MIILDTPFIIALLNKGEVHHSGAVKILHQLDNNEKLVTHPLVVQETISVIARKCREQRGDCREWMQKTEGFFTALKLVEFLSDRQEVLDIVAESDCSLSYIDAVLVLAAKYLGARVLTFDNVLKELAGSR